MSTALTVLNNPTAIDVQRGGLGFNSKLFKLQPANIHLVQRMTRAEGATPGKLRIKETGQQFDEMHLVLLFEPVERRSYYEGQDFTPDNQLCFSLDNIVPHPKAKVPQAMACANCPKASWERYRQTNNKADIPPCKNFWHNIVIDRITQMPYYFDVRGTSIKPYFKAMQQIARLVALMQSQGKNPNIFDISFKVKGKLPQQGAPQYVLDFYDFAPINETEKEKFGSIFLDFINSRNRSVEPTETELQAQESDLTAEMAQPSPVEGDYIQI